MEATDNSPKNFYTQVGDKWKCNQCDYTSSRGNVIRHLSVHKNLDISRKIYNKKEKPDIEQQTGD